VPLGEMTTAGAVEGRVRLDRAWEPSSEGVEGGESTGRECVGEVVRSCGLRRVVGEKVMGYLKGGAPTASGGIIGAKLEATERCIHRERLTIRPLDWALGK
jgi:hypothetical protein